MADKNGRPPCMMIAYGDWEPMTRRMNDEDLGALFRAVFNYGLYGEMPDDDDESPYILLFDLLKQKVDFDRERYLKVCSVRSENAKKRWHRDDRENET